MAKKNKGKKEKYSQVAKEPLMSGGDKNSSDPRLKEILTLVNQLSLNDPAKQNQSGEREDLIGEILHSLESQADQYAAWKFNQQKLDNRLNDLLEMIVSIASFNFDSPAEIGEEGDIFDAVATGLNALGEELRVSMVSKEFLNSIYESIKNTLIVLDPQLNIQSFNQAVPKILGYTPEELENQPYSILFPPGAFEQLNISQSINETGLLSPETEYITKEGKVIPMAFSCTKLYDRDGNMSGFVCLASDISHQRESQEALRQAELLYRTLFEQSPDGIMIVDPRTAKIVEFNDVVLQMAGYTHQEFKELTIADIEAAESTEDTKARIDKIFREGSDEFETKWRKKDGTIIEIFAKIKLTELNGEKFFHNIVRDITEEKLSKAALITTQQNLLQAQEIAKFGSWERDIKTGIETWSEETIRIYGISLPDDSQAHFDLFYKTVHPDDRKIIKQSLEKALKNIQPYDVEYRSIRANGEVRIFHSIARVIFSKSGEPLRLLGTVQDITAQKRDKEQILKSLREKEVLLKEIHHRVKNNLQIVSSLLYLQSKKSQDQATTDILEESRQRVRSMSLIHEKLYQSSDIAKVDFQDYIRSMTDGVYQSFGVETALPLREIDAKNIHLDIDHAIPCGLIINELVSNAIKHGFPNQEVGKIKVSLTKNSNGEKHILTVTDHGIGLPDKFDLDQENSLGLELVKSLVNQLSGNMTIDSKNGTEIIINFKVIQY